MDMSYNEIPSDDQVVQALRALDGRATALRLCERLVSDGHPRRDSQLAIQRAAERGFLTINSDWSLSVAERQQAVAA